MPSASAKLEKQASTEAVDPLRQAITIIEHKIRNLEKRKVKLESYKEEQKNGKDLNSDQFSAVAKYDEVIQTLEFARELCKQFNGISVDAAKALKKQQRKEQLERTQQEINRVKEILVIQEVLLNVGQESVREDFLAARNGATQLTEEDIKSLDDLYLLLSPKHIPEENMPTYQEQLTHSAEHLINLVEGRPKEVVGTTYAGLKELITRIHTCGYFDQSPEEEEEVAANEEATEEATIQQEEAPVESYGDPCVVPQEDMEANLAAAAPEILPPQPNLASAPVIPPEASFFTPSVPTSNVASANPPFAPHPSSAPMQQQAPLQSAQPHTLPDTFESGFDFIQESQLEVEAPVPPHVDLAGMLVQQPGGGHPPVPSAHFRPTRPGVPQPTTVAPSAPPPSVQTSQLAPVVAEFVASVTAPTPPIPSQTFTNQNFSILPVPGSAQPVVASPTPGIAPPTYPEASAPVSAQIPPAPQSAPAPTTQHIPGFARAPSNSFQAPVPGITSSDSPPNQPIPITMPQQRVPEESEYAATSAAPFVPASVAQSTYSGQGQQPSQAFVPQQQAMGQARFANTYGDTSHVSAAGGDPTSDKARFGAADLTAEATEESDLQTGTSWADTSQEEVFVPQNQNQRGGYGGRGGRGGMNRGRGNSNGYGGRGRGNYQNGRGGYGYRGNQEGGNAYYQNGYQQRDNYGNNSGGGYGNGGYKSGGRGGGGGPSGNGGMQRGGGVNRGRGGGSGRGANMRGGRGNYVRGGAGGGNKQ